MSQDVDGVAEAYRAPLEDDGAGARPVEEGGSAYYVVSTAKLVTLDILTMRLYSMYWFYQHWSVLKRRHFMNVRPTLRALFPIFFVHQLFKTLDYAARNANYSPRWQPSTVATVFIVLSVIDTWLGRANGAAPLVLSLGTNIVVSMLMASAQKVANLAAGDPEGASNAKWGPGALIAAVAGGAFWALALFGAMHGE